MEAEEWKAAVHMYRDNDMWEDAHRVDTVTFVLLACLLLILLNLQYMLSFVLQMSELCTHLTLYIHLGKVDGTLDMSVLRRWSCGNLILIITNKSNRIHTLK